MLFWISPLTGTLHSTSQQQMTACSTVLTCFLTHQHLATTGKSTARPAMSAALGTQHILEPVLVTLSSQTCSISSIDCKESLQNPHHPLLALCRATPVTLLWAKVSVTTWTVSTAVSRSFLSLNKGHTWNTKHTLRCQCACKKRSLF